jgi:hypothetical protein
MTNPNKSQLEDKMIEGKGNNMCMGKDMGVISLKKENIGGKNV